MRSLTMCPVCHKNPHSTLTGRHCCDECNAARRERVHLARLTADKPDVPEAEAGLEIPLEELQAKWGKSPELASVVLCNCKGCGAQIEISSGSCLAECPFCGRKVVAQAARSTMALEQKVVVPFEINHEHAVESMRAYLEQIWLRPDAVKTQLRPEQVRQVYVPFWAFDVTVSTSWSGQLTKRSKGWFGSDGPLKSEPISGSRNQAMDDWLVCASHGIDQGLVEQLEPFSTAHVSSGSGIAALSGVPVERCGISPRAGWAKAELALRQREFRESEADAEVEIPANQPEASVIVSGKVAFGEPRGKIVWLPLYVYSVKTLYGTAQVVVNGETGKVGSKIPYSLVKAIPAGVAVSAAVVTVVAMSGGTMTPVLLVLAGRRAWNQKKKRDRNKLSFVAAR